MKDKKTFPRRDEKGRIKEDRYLFVLHNDDTRMPLDTRIDYIKNNTKEYCIARHEHDINPDGIIVAKPHTHVYVRFENPRLLSGLAKALNVKEAEITALDINGKQGHALEAVIQYFTHRTTAAQKHTEQWPHGKIGYVWQNFNTNMDLSQFFTSSRKTALDKHVMILEYITSQTEYITYQMLYTWAVKNECISEVIRGGWLTKGILQEHNNVYQFQERKKKRISIAYKKMPGCHGIKRYYGDF